MEMGRDHGCTLYAHSCEVERLAKQCGVSADELRPLHNGTTLPLDGTDAISTRSPGSASTGTPPSSRGGGHLVIMHTPGHSGGSICIQVVASGPRGPPAPSNVQSLIVGDTIFPGSCGRLDLPDSDKSAMYDSLTLLRALDDRIKVYPGHGYSGDATSIGQEKRNGLLRPFSREQWLSMHG